MEEHFIYNDNNEIIGKLRVVPECQLFDDVFFLVNMIDEDIHNEMLYKQERFRKLNPLNL